jgi:hypothetical protein
MDYPEMPLFRTRQYAWFFVAMFYTYDDLFAWLIFHLLACLPTTTSNTTAAERCTFGEGYFADFNFRYGDFAKDFAAENLETSAWLLPWLHYHQFVSFAMVSCVLVLSIVNLHPESIRYQLGHLVWTMAVLLLVCAQMMKGKPLLSNRLVYCFIVLRVLRRKGIIMYVPYFSL